MREVWVGERELRQTRDMTISWLQFRDHNLMQSVLEAERKRGQSTEYPIFVRR